MNNAKKQKGDILVILTGGTICSIENDDGERTADVETTKYKIISHFKNSSSPFSFVDFDSVMPLNILSENMTVKTWNTLLDVFRGETFKGYKGIIILHGTDTLAYTSSLLSIMLTHLEIPVMLVSSQLPLDKAHTNGHINFKAATELIMNGIKPNVYAVYQNSDKEIYVHFSSHLLQCENYSNDFFSVDAMKITNKENASLDGKAFETKNNFLNELNELSPCVLNITPYVGINYDNFNLDNISAVVHGTYHSESVCVERSNKQGEFTNFSILNFAKKCNNANVKLFLAPCNESSHAYESTGDALENGILPICGMTREMSYVKTLVGCSLKNQNLIGFINTSVNSEIIY